jgi:diacylglycerol O-acyltransferase/trehalose O-mycolyltransferase
MKNMNVHYSLVCHRMRVAVLVATVAVLLAVAPGAHAAGAGDITVASSTALSPRLTELRLRTPALADPGLVRVLLPTGYDPNGTTRYPVLYLLHGSFDTAKSWTDKGDAEALTKGVPVIVVMPAMAGKGDAGGWASDWRNGGAGGPPEWETFHIAQLIRWVDRTYRTVAGRRGRAIAGLSMGGFSAMSYAARHPDLFAAAASFSGAVDTNNAGVQAVVELETLADGGQPGAIWGPRAADEVYWRAHNPLDLAQNLRGMTLSIRTGDGNRGPYDGPGPPDGIETVVADNSKSLHERLDKLGIAHVYDAYGPGTHSWPYWQRDLKRELPRIMATFATRPKAPSPFTYTAAEAAYDVFDWHVALTRPATEMSELAGASKRGFRLRGSGTATVTTAPLYRPRSVHRVVVKTGGSRRKQTLSADKAGRLRFDKLTLGPGNTAQQYTSQATTKVFTARVAVVS